MERPSHTVLYPHGGGRFGNQLLRQAHWLAWACEHRGAVRVVNLAFWPYAHAFATWRRYPGCVFPLQRGWIDLLARLLGGVATLGAKRSAWRGRHLIGRLIASLPGVVSISDDGRPDRAIDLCSEGFVAGVFRRRLTVCAGWYMSGWPLLERHEARVLDLLAPSPELSETVAARVQGWRRDYDVLIGVFMRGTDYREWRGGRYCYSTERYAEWMREAEQLFAPLRVGFLVTSDESRDPAFFQRLSWRFSSGTVGGDGDWLDAFLELANCDYILSPPSTFAACAAWLGGRKLWALREASMSLAFSQVLSHPLFAARSDSAFGDAVQ